MPYNIEKIKKSVKAHYIETSKFKTNIIAVILSMPLNRETVTKEALIPAVLKRTDGSFSGTTGEDGICL